MTVELEYDDTIFHEKDERSFIKFIGSTLNERKGELLLHSNKWGATIGSIRVITTHSLGARNGKGFIDSGDRGRGNT